MKGIILIGDKAHGKEILGKGSPDGTHKEWIWSRERWKELEIMCKAYKIPVEFTSYVDTEIGLTQRVIEGNKIVDKYPDRFPVFISLHNDASKADGTWGTARGISVWTCKEHNIADTLAELMLAELFKELPETRHRVYESRLGGRDFESNFTVLHGNRKVKPQIIPRYHPMLIEVGFQDNKEDLALLKTPRWNKKVEDSLMSGVLSIEKWVINNIK